MKKYSALIALVVAFVLPFQVFAGQKNAIKGGVCISHVFRNSASVFTCEHIDPVTINELYEKGWRIVSSYSQDWKTYHSTTLIIEQQG